MEMVIGDPIENARRNAEDSREQFKIYLQRRDSEVDVYSRLSWDSQKIAAEIAKLALQSAFLVNGGALIALPPLMQWLSEPERTAVPDHALVFVVGLMLAAASAVSAYINFMCISRGNSWTGYQQALELNAQHEGISLKEEGEYAQAKAKVKNWYRWTRTTAIVALVIGVLSYVCFAIGAFEFIGLARNG